MAHLHSIRQGGLIVLAAGTALLSDAATDFVADSFEEGTNGMPIVWYKGALDSSGVVTNAPWSASAGDLSCLVPADDANRAYSGYSRPMGGATTNWILNLDTEGGVLSRPLDGGPRSFAGESVYIDTLVRFELSDEMPVFTNPALKAAAFVNASSNLVIYHSVDALTATTSVANVEMLVDPARWYRLTIVMGIHPWLVSPAFRVYLDGQIVTSPAAYGDTGFEPVLGGTWFLTPTSDTDVHALLLSGTGQLDELVVRDYPDASFLLTLSFDDAFLDITSSGQSLSSGDKILIGSFITIDAHDWYEVAAVTGSCICVTYSGPTGERVNTSSGVLSSGHAATAFIDARRYAGTYTGGGRSADASKLAAWALANGVGEADWGAHAADWINDYLLNLAPGADAGLKITDIRIDEAADVAVIRIRASDPGLDMALINGGLTIYTCSNLGATWSEAPAFEYRITSQSGEEAVVEVHLTAEPFMKAVVR